MRPGLTPGMTYQTTEGRETAEAIRTLGGAEPSLLLADIAGTMERTARKWLTEFCEGDEQSVGVFVCVERLDTLPDAHQITATATLREIDGRRYLFEVSAVNEHGDVIATGTHERRIIVRRRFAAT